MTARELAEKLKMSDGRCKRHEWAEVWNGLTSEQRERIGHKARWEGVSLMGVLREWPNMFEDDE